MAMWLPVVAVYVWSFGIHVTPIDCSHFMGGIIHWRPVDPVAFDGRVQITHRVTLKSTTCDPIIINSATLSVGRPIRCQSGCSGNIGSRASTLNCTDFGTLDGWSTGEQTFTYNFSAGQSYFELLFSGGDWISLINGSSRLVSAIWEFRVRGNLTYREDTGLVNSPPVVNIPPLIRIQQGCNHTIKVSVGDADGDHVRCRWAESSLNECGGVCRSFPTNLNGRDCELRYTGFGLSTGDYAVALQVEDFISSTATTPLSSVPVQFVVRIQSFPSSSCSSKPELVGDTTLNGSYFEVPFNTSWNTTIVARVAGGSRATSITEFVTASPLGMRKSNLSQRNNPREWQVNITWTPAEYQFGTNIFCFAAMDNIGLQSTQRCVVLLVVACKPPTIVPGSMSPMGEIFSNQSHWSMSIEFDKQFTRPTRNTHIRVFGEGGDEVVTVKTSAAVSYPSNALDRTLIFDVDICQLPVNHTLYVLLDAGIAIGSEFCHAESPQLTDPTLWTFIIMTAEHIDTYTTDFTTVEYTTMHTTDTETTEHTETLELEIPAYTDTNGQISTTAPNVNTGLKTEKNEVASVVCLANSIVITVCTLLSLAFLLGIICGLIAQRCICALLKRKAKRQSKVSSPFNLGMERSDQIAQDHYEMGETSAAQTSDDIYDDITQYCKPA